MKSETLQLLGTLNDVSAQKAAGALQAIEGVSKVTFATPNNQINIDFDDNLTSIQVLRTSLQRAGIDVKKSAHGEEGMCCGSCG